MGISKITILSDKMRGTSFTLSNDQYTVGRAEAADICVPEPTISSCHCTFFKDGESYAIRDEGSTNGTRINGEKLEEGNAVVLKDGDLLQVGSVEMMYENSDGHHSEVRTMTVINLDDTGTVDVASAAMQNLNKNGARRGNSLRDNKKHNAIVYAILGVLGLLVLGGIVFLVVQMMSK